MSRYIDADALADTLFERHCEDCDKRKGMKNGKMRTIYAVGDAPCRACGIDDMICELDEAPTADVRENVRGEWEVIDFEEPRRYGCTKCKMLCFYPYNFCPNCGADMRGEEHEAD